LLLFFYAYLKGNEMSLLATLKADKIKAMKARNSFVSVLLATVIGEVETKSKKNGRELTDAEIVAIIKKFLEGVNDCISRSQDGKEKDHSYVEKTILEGYMPKQLSGEELNHILISLALAEKGPLVTGKVMAHFKEVYPGRYDGKILKACIEIYNGVNYPKQEK
jgi:uncharacterized protein YqeY